MGRIQKRQNFARKKNKGKKRKGKKGVIHRIRSMYLSNLGIPDISHYLIRKFTKVGKWNLLFKLFSMEV